MVAKDDGNKIKARAMRSYMSNFRVVAIDPSIGRDTHTQATQLRGTRTPCVFMRVFSCSPRYVLWSGEGVCQRPVIAVTPRKVYEEDDRDTSGGSLPASSRPPPSLGDPLRGTGVDTLPADHPVLRRHQPHRVRHGRIRVLSHLLPALRPRHHPAKGPLPGLAAPALELRDWP